MQLPHNTTSRPRVLPWLGMATLALASACSSPPRQERAAPVPVAVAPAYAQYGRVSNIELVQAPQQHTSGGGAVVGAVIGGLLGNQVGSGTGRAAATGLGAVGGAVIGNNIEKRRRNDNELYRVSVRFDNGQLAAYDYQRIDDLQVGDRVKYEAGQLSRM